MKRILLALATIAMLAVFSCSKSNGTASTPPVITPPKDTSKTSTPATIGVQIATNARFSLLKLGMNRVGLQATWDSPGPYTLIALNDTAFAFNGLTASQINAFPLDVITTKFRALTLSGKLLSSDIPQGVETRYASIGGDSLFLTRNSRGLFVNGIQVTQPDMAATNGSIFVVSDVPETGITNSVSDIITGDTTNRLLNHMVDVASMGKTNVRQILSSSTVTFFAPTLPALRASKYPDAVTVNSADRDSLAAFLLDHAFPVRLFTADLLNGSKFKSLTGKTANIFADLSGITVYGTAKQNGGKIQTPNQMAFNGLVHVVDHVLDY